MSNAGTGTPGARSIHEEDEQVLAAQQHVTLSTAPGPAPADVTSPQKPVPEAQTPYPLPMPPYGGYFAPMTELLPGDSAGLPNPPYQRCNLAIMLLTDLLVDCAEIDWTVHLPLILHLAFLGLDNPRPLIHEHCKKLLLNSLLVLAAHNDHFSVAKTVLSNKQLQHATALSTPADAPAKDVNYMGGCGF